MLSIKFGQATDPGKVRSQNEDSAGFFLPKDSQQAHTYGFLFALADGVGGMDYGAVASTTAVRVLTEEFPGFADCTPLTTLLTRLMQQANTAVHDHQINAARSSRSMATTLVACALRGDRAVIAHVGDSRCYLVRNGSARLLTEDHTLVNEQRKIGLLSDEEAATSPRRHIITRALGTDHFISADTITIQLQPGDTLVLTSDGVHDATPAEEIAAIASQAADNLDSVAREMVTRAVERDGRDNTTALIVRILAVGAARK